MQFEDSDRSDFWLLSKNVGTQSWPKAQRECFWRSVSGPPSPWPGFSCVCLKKGSLSIDTNDWKKKLGVLVWSIFGPKVWITSFWLRFLVFFINRKLRQKVQNLGGIQLLTPLTKRPTAFQQHPPSIDGFYGCVHFLGGMTETWWAQTIMERCFGNISPGAVKAAAIPFVDLNWPMATGLFVDISCFER